MRQSQTAVLSVVSREKPRVSVHSLWATSVTGCFCWQVLWECCCHFVCLSFRKWTLVSCTFPWLETTRPWTSSGSRVTPVSSAHARTVSSTQTRTFTWLVRITDIVHIYSALSDASQPQQDGLAMYKNNSIYIQDVQTVLPVLLHNKHLKQGRKGKVSILFSRTCC